MLNKFKYQMLKVTDDVKKLKIEAEMEDADLKVNQRILFLESTVEWFKNETIKLTDKNSIQK
jgi:hypothetical protein